MEPKPKKIVKERHHEREDLCITRPAYRQGRKLTAVKVYTVVDESQHLLIRGVPALNLQKELKHLCMRYGDVKLIHQVKDYAEDEEAFTEVFHVLFARIQSARFAKHMIDDKSFFGGVLHVCYAPELETITETRHKLDERKHEVLKRIRQYDAAELRKSQNQSQVTNEPLPSGSGTSQSFVAPVAVPGSSDFSYQSSTLSSQPYSYTQCTPSSSGLNYQPVATSGQSQGYDEPIASTSGINNQSDASRKQTFQPDKPQFISRTSNRQHCMLYSQPSQPFHKPKIPIPNPKPLAEAGIVAREFIPRQTPKAIGPELEPSSTSVTQGPPQDEAIPVKRSQSNKFIPTQVKRIRFN